MAPNRTSGSITERASFKAPAGHLKMVISNFNSVISVFGSILSYMGAKMKIQFLVTRISIWDVRYADLLRVKGMSACYIDR
ncbi:MAG: hypothetical protein DSY42_02025 [Aquifex sp.]|nr:MAG: hypothetical protein DSY42_02025 [Aquifex sp.]